VGVQRTIRHDWQRRNRRRGLGALGAGFVLMLAFGAPAVAATATRLTTDGPWRPGGGGPPSGVGDPHGRGGDLLACLEAFLRELRSRHVTGSQTASNPTPPARNPTPTTTPPPSTTPVTPPPTTPPVTTPPAATAPVTAPTGPTVAIATATPLATRAGVTRPAGRTTSRASAPGGLGSATPPAGGVPAHSPQKRGGQITGVLGSAPSYGLLFTLLGAVLAFLAVQSRVDRRDPRIARAPIDAHRDFRDFE